jgi:hypothetical protein
LPGAAGIPSSAPPNTFIQPTLRRRRIKFCASKPKALYLNEITLRSASKNDVDLAYTTTGMSTYPEIPVSFFSKGKS